MTQSAVRFGDGSGNELYRTCAVLVEEPDGSVQPCGSDCGPEVLGGGTGEGLRIAFTCPVHGVHSVVDPFEGLR